MLILTRKVGEAVMIGHDVKITVLHVKGNQIRLGIDAPSSVAVHREEIFSRIQNSQLSPLSQLAQSVPIGPGVAATLSLSGSSLMNSSPISEGSIVTGMAEITE